MALLPCGDAPLRARWGGRRAGAGRPRKSGRSNVPHTRRASHVSERPVLVTLRTTCRSLRSQYVFPTVRGAISDSRNRGSRRRGAPDNERAEFFRVCEFSVQDAHVHLLVEASSSAALERGVRGLSIRLAKRINRLLFQRGKFIADRYHALQLKTPRAVRNALVYVLANFRKHGHGSDVEAIDPYSSAPYFASFSTLDLAALELPRSRRRVSAQPRAPVEQPRTWLLAKGWRRYGLISVWERPRRSSR